MRGGITRRGRQVPCSLSYALLKPHDRVESKRFGHESRCLIIIFSRPDDFALQS